MAMNRDEFETCAAIARSGLFDAEYYLSAYPDVKASGMDPILHYARFGEKEQRKPFKGFHADYLAHEAMEKKSPFLRYIANKKRGEFMDSIMPIFFAVEKSWLEYLSVAVSSIVNSPFHGGTYEINILHDGICGKDLANIRGMARQNRKIKTIDIRHCSPVGAINGWPAIPRDFFNFIPTLFPYYNKALCLDADIVVVGDLSTLFRMQIENYLCAAVLEQMPCTSHFSRDSPKEEKQCNAYNPGVLLLNCQLAREKEVNLGELKITSVSKGNSALRVKTLDSGWNFQWGPMAQSKYRCFGRTALLAYLRNFSNPGIVHFSGEIKPWNYDDGHLAGYFWKFARQSPYYEKLKSASPYNPDEAYPLNRGEKIFYAHNTV